jgi:hypothetical protein
MVYCQLQLADHCAEHVASMASLGLHLPRNSIIPSFLSNYLLFSIRLFKLKPNSFKGQIKMVFADRCLRLITTGCPGGGQQREAGAIVAPIVGVVRVQRAQQKASQAMLHCELDLEMDGI